MKAITSKISWESIIGKVWLTEMFCQMSEKWQLKKKTALKSLDSENKWNQLKSKVTWKCGKMNLTELSNS